MTHDIIENICWLQATKYSLRILSVLGVSCTSGHAVYFCVHCKRGESVVLRGKGSLAVRQLNVSVSHPGGESGAGLRDRESSNAAKVSPTVAKSDTNQSH